MSATHLPGGRRTARPHSGRAPQRRNKSAACAIPANRTSGHLTTIPPEQLQRARGLLRAGIGSRHVVHAIRALCAADTHTHTHMGCSAGFEFAPRIDLGLTNDRPQMDSEIAPGSILKRPTWAAATTACGDESSPVRSQTNLKLNPDRDKVAPTIDRTFDQSWSCSKISGWVWPDCDRRRPNLRRLRHAVQVQGRRN